MSSCLGIYIEENLIKYAKVTKEKDKTKVETFGVKAYDDLEYAIEQIVQETYSFKIPICVNVSGEKYEYTSMFALLQGSDLDNASITEFETMMQEKGTNIDAIEMRKVYVPNVLEKDKVTVMYMYANKSEVNKKTQLFTKKKMQGLYTPAMTLPTLLGSDTEANTLIVNMDEEITLTRVVKKHIYSVEKIEESSKEVLAKINAKENSLIKSYEICKNTTIYTSEGPSLQDYDLGYLEEIMPTIFRVTDKVKNTINTSEVEIKRIYLTGTLAMVNNIDLYFQENIPNIEITILKPNFVSSDASVNIKDYIEMNTPVSLALAGINGGIKGVNFKKDGLIEVLNRLNIKTGKTSKNSEDKKTKKINLSLGGGLDLVEINLLRITVVLVVIFIAYTMLANQTVEFIGNQIEELKLVESDTEIQIQKVKYDIGVLETRESDYRTRIENIEIIEQRIEDADQTRNLIPNLLQHIMHVIPEGVQLLSIKNETGTKVTMQFQSDKYEQIGYFTAKIKEEQILLNVESTSSKKDGETVVITVEGDLP